LRFLLRQHCSYSYIAVRVRVVKCDAVVAMVGPWNHAHDGGVVEIYDHLKEDNGLKHAEYATTKTLDHSLRSTFTVLVHADTQRHISIQ